MKYYYITLLTLKNITIMYEIKNKLNADEQKKAVESIEKLIGADSVLLSGRSLNVGDTFKIVGIEPFKSDTAMTTGINIGKFAVTLMFHTSLGQNVACKWFPELEGLEVKDVVKYLSEHSSDEFKCVEKTDRVGRYGDADYKAATYKIRMK